MSGTFGPTCGSLMPRALGTLGALVLVARPALSLGMASDLDWPVYGYSYSGTRHVDLRQITPANVASLRPAWRFDVGYHGRFESSPLVVGGTMYVTTGPLNEAIAVDAGTGAVKWRFKPVLSESAPCCGLVNRGVAVSGKRVFFATIDARLYALDARNGRQLWSVAIGNPADGISETMAPLAWRDMVFIGSSGGEFGIRGSITAYRQSDGKMLWRWWSVGPGWEGKYVTSVADVPLRYRNIAHEKAGAPKYRNSWMHGGGPIWMTPSLDTAQEMLYVCVADPAPDYDGSTRPGDNLYTDSIVALNARTGKFKWYFQETPHDLWDYDPASPPVLIDALFNGKRIPAVGEAGKTGWFYIVARDSGKLIRISRPFVPQNHIYDASMTKFGAIIRPGGLGGALGPISYDRSLHRVFLPATDRPEIHRPEDPIPWRPSSGKWTAGTSPPVGWYATYTVAIDVDTGRIVWRHVTTSGRLEGPTQRVLGGTLSSGDLIFAASPLGTLYAYDAASGNQLWSYELGAPNALEPGNETWLNHLRDFFLPIKRWIFRQPPPKSNGAHTDSPPMTYEIGGRQYVAIAADLSPELSIGGDTIVTFALPR